MNGYIYKISNLIDGKCYIGQTIKTIEERWHLHQSKHSTCTYLKNAIQKHGVSNFKIEILATVECADKQSLLNELNKIEHKIINKERCIAPFGYNIREGGRNHSEPRKKSSEEAIKNRATGHKKPVKCNETGQIWPSVQECAAFFNVKSKQISRILKGQRKRLKWQYSFSYALKQSLTK